MYDLSIGGCMFEIAGPIALEVGENVMITLATSPHPAVIVWAFGECVGAKFHAELHAAIVEHYGFRSAPVNFELLPPRDKFGRVLPPLSKRCA